MGHGVKLCTTAAYRLDTVSAALGSGPIDVTVAIWFRLRKETRMSDLVWLTDAACAAAAVLPA